MLFSKLFLDNKMLQLTIKYYVINKSTHNHYLPIEFHNFKLEQVMYMYVSSLTC